MQIMFLPIMGAGMVVGMSLITFLLGIAIGWFASAKFLKKQIKDSPPITESQIKELYSQMGRKPSEKQIQQMMSSFKK